MDRTNTWRGERRGDGLIIARRLEGLYIIQPPDKRPIVIACPCCDAAFETAEAARRAADVVYPVRSYSKVDAERLSV